MACKIATVTRPGWAMGTIILLTTVNQPAPAIRADSSISGGIPVIWLERMSIDVGKPMALYRIAKPINEFDIEVAHNEFDRQ